MNKLNKLHNVNNATFDKIEQTYNINNNGVSMLFKTEHYIILKVEYETNNYYYRSFVKTNKASNDAYNKLIEIHRYIKIEGKK